MQNIGSTEIIIAAVVLLVLFGPKKLPEFAKGLAEAVNELIKPFKNQGTDGKENKEEKKA